MIDLMLLGTGGMLPLPYRWLSSLLVRCEGELTVFDCGEGTQIPWTRSGWGFRRLSAICLSHAHADHVSGLPGLLLAAANSGRVEPVSLFGPVGIGRVVTGLRTIAPFLPYDLTVTELTGGDRFPLPGGLMGSVLAGEHALPCLAYRADLVRARRFDRDRAEALGVPLRLWRNLQQGMPVTWPGGAAAPEDVLGPPRRGLVFAYVTDTRPVAALPAFLADIDLLVCEGTYGDPADHPKAVERGHMTFSEAATLASEARAGALWLTHFSPALDDPAAYLTEATTIFLATTIGQSGLTVSLAFPDEESGVSGQESESDRRASDA